MKIKLFTHTDLDGVSCAILAKLFFRFVDFVLCNYQNINERVKEFINSGEYKNYDKIYITDISISDELAAEIDKLGISLILLDHHVTAESLNKYKWAMVESFNGISLNAGTSLFFEFLMKAFDANINFNIKIIEFVELVRAYDTWDWTKRENGINSKLLNDLLTIQGHYDFIKSMTKKLSEDKAIFSKKEKVLLDFQQDQINKYVQNKEKDLQVYSFKGYKMGVVFAELYTNEVGSTICANHPEIDFIAIISGNNIVSYRTAKDNIKLGLDIASIFGGGGHDKAAGNAIPNKESILKLIFDGVIGKKI